MSSKIRNFFRFLDYKKSFGLAQIPLIIGLLIMAIVIPLVTRLTQQSQDLRNRATYDVCNAPSVCVPVSYNCFSDFGQIGCSSGQKCGSRCAVPTPTVKPCIGVGSSCLTNASCCSNSCVAGVCKAVVTPIPALADCRACSTILTAVDSCTKCQGGIYFQDWIGTLYCGTKNGCWKLADGKTCSAIMGLADSCERCISGKVYQVGNALYCGSPPSIVDGQRCSIVEIDGIPQTVDSCRFCKNGYRRFGLDAYCGTSSFVPNCRACSTILTAVDSCTKCQNGQYFKDWAGTLYCGIKEKCTVIPTPTSTPAVAIKCSISTGSTTLCRLNSDCCSGSCGMSKLCVPRPLPTSKSCIVTGSLWACASGSDCCSGSCVIGKCKAVVTPAPIR